MIAAILPDNYFWMNFNLDFSTQSLLSNTPTRISIHCLDAIENVEVHEI